MHLDFGRGAAEVEPKAQVCTFFFEGIPRHLRNEEQDLYQASHKDLYQASDNEAIAAKFGARISPQVLYLLIYFNIFYYIVLRNFVIRIDSNLQLL